MLSPTFDAVSQDLPASSGMVSLKSQGRISVSVMLPLTGCSAAKGKRNLWVCGASQSGSDVRRFMTDFDRLLRSKSTKSSNILP